MLLFVDNRPDEDEPSKPGVNKETKISTSRSYSGLELIRVWKIFQCNAARNHLGSVVHPASRHLANEQYFLMIWRFPCLGAYATSQPANLMYYCAFASPRKPGGPSGVQRTTVTPAGNPSDAERSGRSRCRYRLCGILQRLSQGITGIGLLLDNHGE